MKKYTFIFSLYCFIMSSCGDFLQEYSNDLVYAKTCSDLEELLIGNGYMKNVTSSSLDIKKKDSYFPWIHVMDDDVEALIAGQEEINRPFSKLEGFYTWQANPFNVQATYFDDPVWSHLYEHIAVLNVILGKVDEFTEDTEEARNSVKGQSYFLRAAYYYLLVNFYAKPYEAATASNDPGVPLKLTPVVEDVNYVRDPVESVYNQIVDDLVKAIDCLEGITMKSYNRANEYAARLMLSRVYCYMGKWELVPELCKPILEQGYALDNLLAKDIEKGDTWLASNSPEIIFTQGSNASTRVFETAYNGTTFDAFEVSPELSLLFDWHQTPEGENLDCRKALLCPKDAEGTTNRKFYDRLIPRKLTGNDTASMDGMLTYVSDCFLLRLSEVYLNMAEAYAMTGQDGEACSLLKTLMATRVANLGEISRSGEELVKFIRDERRRELCFEGQRWFDLRRYAVSPKYPDAKAIRHRMFEHNAGKAENAGNYTGYFQLPAYPDGGWVLPIPSYDIEVTDGSIENNERENCIFYEN